jgi:hypothetical protein
MLINCATTWTKLSQLLRATLLVVVEARLRVLVLFEISEHYDSQIILVVHIPGTTAPLNYYRTT